MSPHGPLMKCGHSAQGIDKDGNPVCVICAGLTPDAYIIAENPPDLTGRKARCHYYGKPIKKGMYNAAHCLFGGCKDGICHCEEDSRVDLPFFEYGGDVTSAPPELLKERNDLLKQSYEFSQDMKFVWDDEEKEKMLKEKEELTQRIRYLNKQLRLQATRDGFYCGCHGWD